MGRRRSSPRASDLVRGAACAGAGPARTSSRRRSTPCTADARRPTGAQVVALYDQLLALAPTPVVALNRAVAVAEVDGPRRRAGAWSTRSTLERLPRFHAVRADLLRRLGRFAEAADAYAAAVACTSNAAEVAFLEARRADVTAVGRRASSRP